MKQGAPLSPVPKCKGPWAPSAGFGGVIETGATHLPEKKLT